MKLNSIIARYIRRCGYALALTLTTGTGILQAQETVIEYLTDEVPAGLVSYASTYEMDIELSKPEAPEGTTVWDTASILDAVQNGDGAIRHWAPFRSPLTGKSGNWDYGVFSPYVNEQYVQEVTQNSFTVIKDAYRPNIQSEVNRKIISYVGASSLRPGVEESQTLTNLYAYSKDAEFYTKDANGKLQKQTLRVVYNEEGKGIYYYDSQNRGTLYDKDGNELTPTPDTVIAAPVGDGDQGPSPQLTKGTRPYIIATDKKIQVYNNTLVIDHSGFGLAIAANVQYGDAYNNLLYIHDVRTSDDLAAATVRHGDSHDNTLILARSEAVGLNVNKAASDAGVYIDRYNNSGKVIASWSGSLADNDAWNNKAFIYGSSVYQDTSAAEAGGNVHDNTLFINFSQISIGLFDTQPSHGGYSNGYGKAYNNMLIVDDTYDAIAAGLVEEDNSYYQQNTVEKTSSVPLVSTVYEDIVGGDSDCATGADAVHHNKVVLKGITVYDKDAGQNVTTTIQGNVFGGIASNEDPGDFTPTVGGSATNNVVSIEGTNIKRDVIVPVLTNPWNNGWSTKQISINVGCITGGFVGAPELDSCLPGNADSNLVVIRNSYLENSVYGGRNNAWWSMQETNAQGKETGVGYGNASNNVVILENLRTPIHETYDVNREHSYDTAIYGGWAENGKTNNNHMYISGTNNAMDDTFLHGGHGHRAQTNAAGELLGKDGTVLVPGAHYFDGVYFYGADKATIVGTYSRAKLRNDSGNSSILNNLSAFDGTSFYDAKGNETVTIHQTTLAVKKNAQQWRDYLQYSKKITDVQTGANGELSSCNFYVEGSASPIATFANGTITKNDGVVLISGITRAEIHDTTADGQILRASFYNGDDLVAQIGTFLTSRSGGNMKGTDPAPYNAVQVLNGLPLELTGEITKNADGTQTLHGVDGKTYTFTNSEISTNSGTKITIDSTKHVYENGVVLTQAGSAYSMLLGLTGYDEYDTYTRNNWLHVDGFQGKIRGFDHFEKLRFIFKKNTNLKKPLITLTGAAEETKLSFVKTQGGTSTPVDLKVNIDEIAHKLKPGDVIPVIGHQKHEEIAGMRDIPKNVVDDSKKYRNGVTSTFTLETEFKEWSGGLFDNFGVIEVMDKTYEATQESKALVEGRIATLTLNNMGGNLVAEQGIDSACRALEGSGTAADANRYVAVEQNGKGALNYVPKDELAPGNRLFFAMSGAHNKVDSGSDVDVDGTNAMVGISRGFLAKRALTLGAFLETGWGKYHTNNNFGIGAYVPHVRGTGETSYVGAGALLRYHLKHLGRKLEGLSLDASIRAGRQETDYSSADLVDDKGNYASYEHESDYIAGHVGINYTLEPTDKVAATFYARYLWTHISNDEAIVCGETVSFEDMHSNRFRFGTRINWMLTEKWTPYVGAAYEWECSGTARANTQGVGITAPSMRGGSVIGELGVIWQPSLARALWLEAALQGSVGKNENYGARIGVSIGF